MDIKKNLDKIKELASAAPEQKETTLIIINDEQVDGYYCPECSEKIIGWLIADGEKPDFNNYAYEKDYWNEINPKEIEKEETYYVIGGADEWDGCLHCAQCGWHLNMFLTDHGIDSELEHFESCGINTPDDWRHFLDVCERLVRIEDEDFGIWFTAAEEKAWREMYERANKIARKHIEEVAK
jgi:hypothetical protein